MSNPIQAPLSAITLSDLILRGSFDPAAVIVMRHRPKEENLRKLLPWWVSEAPELFNAYQRAHGGRQEGAMQKLCGHGLLASFIGLRPGEATFAGFFRINGAEKLTQKQFWELPENAVLKTHGMIGWDKDDGSRLGLWFDLQKEAYLSEWVGRLSILWPPPERSWWRRAEKNVFPVISISEESRFSEKAPNWRRMVLTWEQLRAIPPSWRSKLNEWRGIYLIRDHSDGKLYVGSAYGEENLMGRWLNYAATGHGGNKHLRGRDAAHFSFSILERVSPDMPADEVIRLEASWKERLHSGWPLGLNDN